MFRVRVGCLVVVGVLLASCSSDAPEQAAGPAPEPAADTTVPTSDSADSTTSSTGATTSSTSTTTTTTEPEDPCVATVDAGDSLSAIADEEGVALGDLLEENRLAVSSIVHPGDALDVCIGNEIDDVTGASRLPPGPAAVRRQQQQLNDLFAPYIIADLSVDGDSGPLTRQLLCAARMGLGLRISADSMSEDSPEEQALYEAESLRIPAGAPTWANKWILIDETCQVMYVGEGGNKIVNVYPTSTGEPGFETRNVGGVAAFRFNPAVENGGWHDSSAFPVGVDNPLNGNMYKPLYFSNGQAIHGANYVPPNPQSKGCARMFTWHQDTLLDWLNLDDNTEPTWQRNEIGVVVTVQGEYRPED
ncbi:MAG: L,D-transpeptidase family protein [Ilumatobacteraceae bacterium]